MSNSFIIVCVALAILGQCHGDLVDDVCSKSNNRGLCLQVLGKSRGLDAKGLANVALPQAQVAARGAIATAKSISGFKEIIDTCIENFNDVVDILDECKPLIPNGSKSDLQTKGSAALTSVGTCGDEFGDKEPANLKQASDKAYSLVQLFLIIVNTFPNR